MKLARGPWKPIFEGEWFGHRIEVLQNNEKSVATFIHDGKGAVVFIDHYFVCSGQLGKLSEKLRANSQVLQKNLGTFNAAYMILSGGPEYYTTDRLEDGFEEVLEKLDEAIEEFNDTAHQFGVEATDLRHASEEYSLHAFSEPSLLVAAIKTGKTALSQKAAQAAVLILGKTSAGEVVEEKMTDLFSSIVTGKDRKNAMHVLVENTALSRLTAVVFDDSGDFQKIEQPNKDFDYRTYPSLQAVGMPLKSPNTNIDLNVLDARTLREMLEVNVAGEKQFHGQEALRILTDAVEGKSGKIHGLEDVIKALVSSKEDEFQKYRAMRWLLAVEDRYPNMLGGEVDAKAIISPAATSGSVALVNAGLPRQLKRALTLSILKALSKQLEGSEPKAVFFYLNGQELFDNSSRLSGDVAELLSKAGQKGVGYCLGAEHASDVHAALVSGAEASIEMVSAKEAAVKKKRSKPYRLLLRPPLSE